MSVVKVRVVVGEARRGDMRSRRLVDVEGHKSGWMLYYMMMAMVHVWKDVVFWKWRWTGYNSGCGNDVAGL